jgi:ribosomal protein S18 acetylase RimI-like enzyme
VIRRLGLDDVEAYLELRRRALEDAPLAFSASPDDDLLADAAAVREQLRRAPDSVLVGAFEARLVGIVGLFRDRHLKMAHKAYVWGLSVEPAARGRGLGSALVAAAIAHARSLSEVCWVQLSVSSPAGGARSLCQRHGFRVWGTEPDALRFGGRSVVEYHMALELD